ncbi:hypothetical protein P7C71_g4659, partial [Lecanoromycetidae sp. Uapishka_2]
MPPPLPVENESEAESVAEEIPAKAKEEPIDVKMKDEVEEEEEDEDDEDEETFIVESILDHRSDFEDGQMRYEVKWKGYEKKADRTWEVEENLDGAHEILEEYWKSVGGKPVPGKDKSEKPKKRARQSSSSAKPDNSKRPKTEKSKSKRKSNGAMEHDTSPAPLTGYTEEGDDDWKAPTPKDGAWDPLVQSVDTVVKENDGSELWGYLIWNEKNADGRFYRSKAKLPTIYRACPQRMLHFYEKHL